MIKASDIYNYLDSYAPVKDQLGYDNAGFLFGSRNTEEKRVLLSLDATTEVIKEAAEFGAELIITHHPVIFKSVKCVFPEDTTGKKIYELADKKLCVISMHTNLDAAPGGVNDSLIKKLGAEEYFTPESAPFKRIGNLNEEKTLHEYIKFVKSSLHSNGLRYYDAGRPVKKIGCIGGAGDEGLTDAYNLGCDTYVTADIRYHVFLDAKELGMNLIDADHFCTENPVMHDLKMLLDKQFPGVIFKVSDVHCQTAQFL